MKIFKKIGRPLGVTGIVVGSIALIWAPPLVLIVVGLIMIAILFFASIIIAF